MTPTRQRILGIVAAGLLAASNAPAAAARPAERFLNLPHADTSVRAAPGLRNVDASAQPTGFDWGDAEVGAGAGAALSALAAGGALLAASRRRARSERSAA
jgi:hypothetical protein